MVRLPRTRSISTTESTLNFSQHPFTHARVTLGITLFALLGVPGCGPNLEPRVYDAPKIASEFVKQPPELPARRGPMMSSASSIPLENRRILSAAIPFENEAYFLKTTDTIDRLNFVTSDFRSVVEKFDIDPAKRELRCDLPSGWNFRWRDSDIALAEINVDVPSGKPVQFTVTQLPRPNGVEAWSQYLLENINRWRGQLSLPNIDLSKIEQDVAIIPRAGSSLPGYVFDARGSSESAGPKTEAPMASAAAKSSKFIYDKPDSWIEGAARPPRLATFTFGDASRPGEVAVSKANNAPVANASMWFQQIVANASEETVKELAEKAVQAAEDIHAGNTAGKLYSIRSSDQTAPRAFLVAAIPTSETESIFVKVVSDPASLDEQKPNLIRFVNSLRWE